MRQLVDFRHFEAVEMTVAKQGIKQCLMQTLRWVVSVDVCSTQRLPTANHAVFRIRIQGVFRIQKLKKEVRSKTILWWFNLLDLLQHYIFKLTSFDEKILQLLNNYILFSYKCIAKKYPEPNLGAFWIRIRIELFGWIRVQWIRSRNTAAKCQHQIVHLHCILYNMPSHQRQCTGILLFFYWLTIPNFWSKFAIFCAPGFWNTTASVLCESFVLLSHWPGGAKRGANARLCVHAFEAHEFLCFKQGHRLIRFDPLWQL